MFPAASAVSPRAHREIDMRIAHTFLNQQPRPAKWHRSVCPRTNHTLISTIDGPAANVCAYGNRSAATWCVPAFLFSISDRHALLFALALICSFLSYKIDAYLTPNSAFSDSLMLFAAPCRDAKTERADVEGDALLLHEVVAPLSPIDIVTQQLGKLSVLADGIRTLSPPLTTPAPGFLGRALRDSLVRLRLLTFPFILSSIFIYLIFKLEAFIQES